MGVGDSPDAHEIPDDILRNESAAMAFTPEDVRRNSPKTLSLVELKSQRDLRHLPQDLRPFDSVSATMPRLGDCITPREFDMTNDSKHFPPLEKWEAGVQAGYVRPMDRAGRQCRSPLSGSDDSSIRSSFQIRTSGAGRAMYVWNHRSKPNMFRQVSYRSNDMPLAEFTIRLRRSHLEILPEAHRHRIDDLFGHHRFPCDTRYASSAGDVNYGEDLVLLLSGILNFVFDFVLRSQCGCDKIFRFKRLTMPAAEDCACW